MAPAARRIACLSALVLGCALTPDYERPELDLPEGVKAGRYFLYRRR